MHLRALWTKATNHKDDHISRLTKELASCLWDMDEYDDKVVYFNERHLKSDVATDSDNELLHNILSNQYRLDQEKINTVIKKSHSNYEKNYLYFVKKIDDLATNRPGDWFKFCRCLLDHCIILPIECDGQDNALRIFNTINDRGVSLATADIFKGIIYQRLNNKEREEFANAWKELEQQMINSPYIKKEDTTFLFTQLMHIYVHTTTK